jgi:hypothetical protein
LASFAFDAGKSVGVTHCDAARNGLSRYLFEGHVDGGGGTLAIDYLSVDELGDDGRFVEVILFDPDDLDAAYDELDARFAAGEAARHLAMWENAQRMPRAAAMRDWEALASLFAPDFVIEDHRLLGWGTLRSGDEYVARVRTLVDMRPDVGLRIDHVLAFDDRTVLLVATWAGSESSGMFEIPVVVVSRVAPGPDGRIQRWHFYDLDQLDAARAMHRELGTAAVARIENAATRAGDRYDEACRARDWERLVACHASTYRESDRRRSVLLDFDRDQSLESLGWTYASVASRRRSAGHAMIDCAVRLRLETGRPNPACTASGAPSDLQNSSGSICPRWTSSATASRRWTSTSTTSTPPTPSSTIATPRARRRRSGTCERALGAMKRDLRGPGLGRTADAAGA